MANNRFIIVISFMLFLTSSCGNQVSTESEKLQDESDYDNSDSQKEVFDPEISIDSLNKIEEELDEKLKEFDKEMEEEIPE